MSNTVTSTADLFSPSIRQTQPFDSSVTFSGGSQSDDIEMNRNSSFSGGNGGKSELNQTPSPPPAKNSWRALFPAIPGVVVLLTVVFFCFSLWLFGSLSNSNGRAHNLNLLVVDFDGGAVGSSLLAAASSLNGNPNLPTFDILPAAGLTPEEINKRVFDGKAWGAIYSTSGASNRFSAAMASGAETSYDATQALVYTGVETRYTTIWSSILLTAILKTEGIATAIFFESTVSPLLASSINGTSPALSTSQLAILNAPISSTFVNPAPFQFAARVLVNTVGMVLVCLMQFFFIMGLNGIMTGLRFYHRVSVSNLLKFRYPLKLGWTVLCAIVSLLWVLPVTENTLGAKEVFALWTVTWSYAYIFFNTFDIITSFIPLPFVPPFVLASILTSVAATVYPIELQPDFYKIHYMFPSHANWMIQIVIFGKGAVQSNLKYIGVLAAWIVVTEIGSLLGQRHRSRASMKEDAPPAVAH